jgi:ribosomal protein S18 acetylase RimI-like enzyme
MIQIIPYQPSYKQDFYNINKEWISNMFKMEPIDELVLSQPDEMLLNPGGYIWLAKDDKLGVIGTIALRKTGESEFELTKMGVLEKARGLKAGQIMLRFVIDFVNEQKISNCYLLTNSACEAAIHLYLKNGFEHDLDIKNRFASEYARCDVAMRLRG